MSVGTTSIRTAGQPGASAAIVAFATGGWAMRAPIRDAGRALLAATIARALAGARSEAVEIALGNCEPGTPRLAAGPIGRTERIGVIDAALIDGIAAGTTTSIATPVVCAALAVGEAAHAAGAVVLDAIIAGTEVAVRLAASLGANHIERGWAIEGTCGRIGAVVAATRIFGLNAERTRNALGIAATSTGGLRSAGGTMTACYVHGLAAADGVEAALLARFGFTGAPLSIDGRRGLAALMSATFAPEALVEGLGERYTFGDLPDATAHPVVPDALRGVIDRIEKLPALDELLAAAR